MCTLPQKTNNAQKLVCVEQEFVLTSSYCMYQCLMREWMMCSDAPQNVNISKQIWQIVQVITVEPLLKDTIEIASLQRTLSEVPKWIYL